jgi:hypothetical protein
MRDVAGTQQRLLGEMISANRATWFGQRHGFDAIGSRAAYQERVPCATYADLAPLIERVARGEPNVLTAEPVRLLEPTSGTTIGEKLIPYTLGLRRQFQRGVAAWIADLFSRRPGLRAGRAYWSISPALGPSRRSAGGIPIGFASDAEYLGRLEQWALRRLLVAPQAVSSVDDMDAFRYCTLRYLLAAEDLTLISIWNPTFLLALFERLPAWQERLCGDIRLGALTPPGNVPVDVAARLRAGLRPAPRRAEALRQILRSRAALAESLREAWPRLQLISCWTDAAAGQFLTGAHGLVPRRRDSAQGTIGNGSVRVPAAGRRIGLPFGGPVAFLRVRRSRGGRYQAGARIGPRRPLPRHRHDGGRPVPVRAAR